GTGSFNFPSVAAFLTGTANSFSVTLGSQSSSIAEGALGFFFQDNFRFRSNLTFELGLRYEWNLTPTERYDRFIVFDPQTPSRLRSATNLDVVYPQKKKTPHPRVGFAWVPFRKGKPPPGAPYALLPDQRMTSLVPPPAQTPPLAIPLTFT